MPKMFDTRNIILARINEDDLHSYLVDVDLGEDGQPRYMLDELANVIMAAIPEYVFAQYENPDIPQTEVVDRLRNAAKSIYRIKHADLMKKAYLKDDANALAELQKLPYYQRGEFGEVLLHLLLRDFHGTIPLVSKVYFKDSHGVPAHGFDAVHISPNERILWLGESKLYANGKRGLDALLSDIAEHFKRDYLNEQVAVIRKGLQDNLIPQRDKWIQILNSCSKLRDQLAMINIPLLCTYPHDIYRLHTNLTSADALTYHETNIRELKRYFDSKNIHPLKQELNIILLLFPVRDKKELIALLHKKLWHMQNI